MHVRYLSRFFVQVGHETIYGAIGNHNFFPKLCHHQLPKLLRTSVKPVFIQHLCTGFTEVLNNFGKSDDDMF